MSAKKKAAKQAPKTCPTCGGSGWVWSGVGHFGEQDGGHKSCGSQCQTCIGIGTIEPE